MRLGSVTARLAITVWTVLLFAASAAAQDGRKTTAGAVEGIVGHAVFADESPIHHSVYGVAARLRVTERLAVGPEVVRMIGPGVDRDWFLSGGVWFDLMSPGPLRPGKVVPFVSGGFGLLAHTSEFGTFKNLYYGGGGGVRVHITDRLYIAPEVLFASELHIRTVARIGYHIPRAR
jgi:hypothetical protein